jgi:hypothetical protein
MQGRDERTQRSRASSWAERYRNAREAGRRPARADSRSARPSIGAAGTRSAPRPRTNHRCFARMRVVPDLSRRGCIHRRAHQSRWRLGASDCHETSVLVDGCVRRTGHSANRNRHRGTPCCYHRADIKGVLRPSSRYSGRPAVPGQPGRRYTGNQEHQRLHQKHGPRPL